MLGRAKQWWRAIRSGPSGRRFQEHYRLTHEAGGGGGWGRIVRIALAAVALVIALLLVVLPGPAFVFFIAAGALLAADSLLIARLMDRGETLLRPAWRWLQRKRKQRRAKPAVAGR